MVQGVVMHMELSRGVLHHGKASAEVSLTAAGTE